MWSGAARKNEDRAFSAPHYSRRQATAMGRSGSMSTSMCGQPNENFDRFFQLHT